MLGRNVRRVGCRRDRGGAGCGVLYAVLVLVVVGRVDDGAAARVWVSRGIADGRVITDGLKVD